MGKFYLKSIFCLLLISSGASEGFECDVAIGTEPPIVNDKASTDNSSHPFSSGSGLNLSIPGVVMKPVQAFVVKKKQKNRLSLICYILF